MSVEPAVIFDLDGLLADTEPLWTESARRLLQRRGLQYAPELKARTIGRHPLEVIGIYRAHYQLDEEPAALLEERLTILRELYRSQLRAMPGAIELCRSVAEAGIAAAVASSSPSELIELVLERLALREQVRLWVGSDLVERGKPAPDLFLLAAARLQARPERCVVLEDSPAGLLAARAAGMRCVAVPGPDSPASLPPHDLRVASLTELTPERLLALLPPQEEEESR